MRTYKRIFASLFLTFAIIFAGFTSPAVSTADASVRGNKVLHRAAKEKGKPIPKGKKKKGDVLIFLSGGRAYHSAIYAGGGKMGEAQRSGTHVDKHKIWSSGYVVRRP